MIKTYPGITDQYKLEQSSDNKIFIMKYKKSIEIYQLDHLINPAHNGTEYHNYLYLVTNTCYWQQQTWNL